MEQRRDVGSSGRTAPAVASRSATCRTVHVALLLALIASVLSGCIIVPVGYHDGYGHGYYHYHHGWDR